MNERERWIVYPLLFLALGASLRDKIIKTTESQRIKCQGLMVYDERENKILALMGPEHFPEVQFNSGHAGVNYINVDEVQAGKVEVTGPIQGGSIGADVISAKAVKSITVESALTTANVVRAKTVQTERLLGPALKRSDGKVSFPLWNWWSALNLDPSTLFKQQNPPGEPASAGGAPEAPEAPGDAQSPSSGE